MGPVDWLIDTGSGHDLIGKKDLPAWFLKENSRKTMFPATLNTANGSVRADVEVDVPVPALGTSLQPLLLASTPAAR